MALIALATAAVKDHPHWRAAAAPDRRVRRVALLRRRGADARDLGALGGGGAGGGHLGVQALRRADRGGRAARAVRLPEPRHRDRRPAVRPGHAGLVPRHRRRRPARHRAAPGDPRGAQPGPRAGFLASHGGASFVVLGAVVLAVTGAEALYADMGHFGKGPVRIAWFGLVAPALVLNYFGQGALLIGVRTTVQNPFYLLFPAWALYPMVALATAATVIASQAVISGAYSITKQAIQLGFLPRMTHRADLRARARPDLHAGHQLAAAGRRALGGDRLRFVHQSRGGLRRRGDRDHDGGHPAHFLRHPLRAGAIRCCCAWARRDSSSSSTSPSSPRRCSRWPTAAGSRWSSAAPCSPSCAPGGRPRNAVPRGCARPRCR